MSKVEDRESLVCEIRERSIFVWKGKFRDPTKRRFLTTRTPNIQTPVVNRSQQRTTSSRRSMIENRNRQSWHVKSRKVNFRWKHKFRAPTKKGDSSLEKAEGTPNRHTPVLNRSQRTASGRRSKVENRESLRIKRILACEIQESSIFDWKQLPTKRSFPTQEGKKNPKHTSIVNRPQLVHIADNSFAYRRTC